MTEWNFYALTGFVKEEKFDKTQLEDRLDVGLYPSLFLKPSYESQEIIDGLCSYLKKKSAEGYPVEMTGHVSSSLTKEKEQAIKRNDIERCIDFVYRINKKLHKLGLEESVVKEVDIHSGFLHSFEEDQRIRKEAKEKGRPYGNLDVTCTEKEYWSGLENIRENFEKTKAFGQKREIKILVENVNGINFATDIFYEVTKNDFDLEEYKKGDIRHGPTGWIPTLVNKIDYGHSYDLDHITSNGFLCFDVEHHSTIWQYSQKYNSENMGAKKPENSIQRKILEKCGLYIKRREPMIFERPIDTKSFIEERADRIKECHLVGQINSAYWDNGVKKIGSHMPILSEKDKDPLGIIEDTKLRKKMARERMEKLKKEIRALKKTTCEKATFEISLLPGMNSGDMWRYYNRKSLLNARSIYRSV